MSARRREFRAAERRNRSKRASQRPTPFGVQRAIDYLLATKPESPPDYDVDRFVVVGRYDAGHAQTTLHELSALLVTLRAIGDGDIATGIERGRFPGGLTMLALASDGWRVLTVFWPESMMQHAAGRGAKS